MSCCFIIIFDYNGLYDLSVSCLIETISVWTKYDQSDCFHISCWILVYCDPLSCDQWSTISEITKIVSLTDSLLSNQWNTISEMTKTSISDWFLIDWWLVGPGDPQTYDQYDWLAWTYGIWMTYWVINGIQYQRWLK